MNYVLTLIGPVLCTFCTRFVQNLLTIDAVTPVRRQARGVRKHLCQLHLRAHKRETGFDSSIKLSKDQCVNAKLIAKTEAEYSGVIVRLLVRMRESGRRLAASVWLGVGAE